MAISCPRCGGEVRRPDLMHTEWRCDQCGPVLPWRILAEPLSPATMAVAVAAARDGPRRMPLWCPWPLPPNWTVTGAGWAGDDRQGVKATALACSGPAPLGGGPADVVLVAEEPGVGLGAHVAGINGLDPGPYLGQMLEATAAHAKVKVAGHPTALWSVDAPDDRSAYVGEAMGLWLYAVAWPSSTGYLLAEPVVLHDLTEWLPPELVYGAPSPHLHGHA